MSIFFSVIIPLYNKEKSITSTVQSVLNQSYENFELIIVNDGSTDNSLNVVSEFSDHRIRVLDKQNGGVSSARNFGIQHAQYEWLSFLDADDLWSKEHLYIFAQMISKYPAYKVFVSSRKEKCEKKEDLIITNIFKDFQPDISIRSVIAKECFNKIGGFDERLVWGEDINMWIRIGRSYDIVKSPNVTAYYRQDAENRSISKKVSIANRELWYFDFKDSSISKIEHNYYRRAIIRAIVGDVIKRHDFKSPCLLLKKFWKNLINF